MLFESPICHINIIVQQITVTPKMWKMQDSSLRGHKILADLHFYGKRDKRQQHKLNIYSMVRTNRFRSKSRTAVGKNAVHAMFSYKYSS